MKKIIAAMVLAVACIVGAFFVGMASADPTTSEAYRALQADLKDRAEDLSSTQENLDTVEQALADAEAQVDALTSVVSADSDGAQGEPAVSNGAALAPRNIKLGVRVRSKECFGSAGCIVDVQIDPAYVGTQDLTDGSWEITYELRGGEDGPVIETMTLQDGTWSFPSEQSLDTSSSAAAITAVVTAVYPLD